MQTRLFHFGGSKAPAGEPSWQGNSVASWQKQAQSRGFGAPSSRPQSAAPRQERRLKVVTTHMRPGYLRKNGVPYSADAVMTEILRYLQLRRRPLSHRHRRSRRPAIPYRPLHHHRAIQTRARRLEMEPYALPYLAPARTIPPQRFLISGKRIRSSPLRQPSLVR